MSIRIAIFFLALTSTGFAQSRPKVNVQQQFALAEVQYRAMLASHPDLAKTPQSFSKDGKQKDMPTSWWCSGFFGASLWYLYEFSGDTSWRSAADRWTMAVQKEQYNTGTHDLGFMIYCPFGNGYRLVGSDQYKKIMITGAQSLSTRFNPAVGLIKSWDAFGQYKYPVIIDNMMNLELLFWASAQTGDKRLRDICIKHADATIKNHYRKDYSSYHVVCYDSAGNILAKKTAQGFSDESAWARGQAWGLYGFTVMYRETKNKKYLDQAVGIAKFMLNHPNLPADKVPYWDFNAPGIPSEERDASAAAITASALLELSGYVKPERNTFFAAAEQILESLSGPAYRASEGENGNFLLKHCVGHKPAKSEVDVPLIYADYYYLEALLRYDHLMNNNKKN